MKKSTILAAIYVLFLSGFFTTANAALITNLYDLDIDGTKYDVTFHTGSGDSFNALWDADNDGVFGGGTSLFSSGPMFWGNGVGANLAAIAIVVALGSVDTTSSDGSDGFFIPYRVTDFSLTLTSGNDQIFMYSDLIGFTNSEVISTEKIFDVSVFSDSPYVSFEVSAVPVPASVWLFGSGLLGLIGVARRKKA